MHIILTANNKVIDIIPATNIEIREDVISYAGGEIKGAKETPLVLDEDVEISLGDEVTQAMRDKDKSKDYQITEEVTVEDIKKALDIILKAGGRK